MCIASLGQNSIDFSKYKKTNQAQQLTPVNPMKIIQPFPNVVVDYKPLIQAPKKDVLPNVAKPSAHLEIEEKKDNAIKMGDIYY